eukprot:90640-Hanusia_phi.AAC.5
MLLLVLGSYPRILVPHDANRRERHARNLLGTFEHLRPELLRTVFTIEGRGSARAVGKEDIFLHVADQVDAMLVNRIESFHPLILILLAL